MASARYRQMSAEINRLRKALIPKTNIGVGAGQTPRASIRTLSYRVLCHAEIEHYIEDRVFEIAIAAKEAWEQRRHVSNTTLCLMGFSGLEMPLPPATFQAAPKDKQKDWASFVRPDERLAKAINGYVKNVRVDNHGIREANLVALLLPVGFRVEEVDDLLVIELNEFSKKRGSAAHSSVGGYVKQGVNPEEEIAQVSRILEGLLSIDKKLTDLLRAAK